MNRCEDTGLKVTLEVLDDSGDNSAFDVALPAQARLADVLPEVLSLAEVDDSQGLPWRVYTASGHEVDPTVPLAHTPMRQGARLIVAHAGNYSPPRLVDAAEALSLLPTHRLTPGRAAVTLLAGLVGVIGFIPLLAGIVPTWLGCVAAAVIAVLIGARAPIHQPRPVNDDDVPTQVFRAPVTTSFAAARNPTRFSHTTAASSAHTSSSPPVESTNSASSPGWGSPGSWCVLPHPQLVTSGVCCVVAAFASGLAGFTAVHQPGDSALGFATAIGAAASLVGVAAVIATTQVSLTLVTAVITLATIAGVGACGAIFADTATELACFITGIAVTAITLCPGWCLKIAGLSVPHVAPAGEEIPPPPAVDSDTTDRARMAVSVHDGIIAGLCIAAAPASIIAAFHPSAFVVAGSAVACGAVLLHSTRMRTNLSGWSLHVCALAAASGMVIYPLAHHGSHTSLYLLAGLITVIACTAPLWAVRLDSLTPPTVRRLERAEIVCVCCVLPLSLHLAGLFLLIRGL